MKGEPAVRLAIEIDPTRIVPRCRSSLPTNENGPRRARLVSIRGAAPDQSWFIREWVRVSFMNTYTSSEQAMQAVTYQ
ncbi:hypothetical protein D9M68_979610 [compost metagenome]